MHRVIMKCAKGGQLIDHADMDGLNNQKSNLRIKNKSFNSFNRVSWGKKSKHRGVSKHSTWTKWHARISKDKVRYDLGYFKTENEAAIAYNEKCIELYGNDAILNVIE